MNHSIILFASARRRGNTGKLADYIAAQANIEVLDLGALNINAYDYEHRNRQDDFEPLMERILQKRNIIFASPVYWYAVAPPMKMFLDRISDFLELDDLKSKGRQLREKNGFVLSTSHTDAAAVPFIDAFKMTFHYLGMHFKNGLNVNCLNGYRAHPDQAAIEAFLSELKC